MSSAGMRMRSNTTLASSTQWSSFTSSWVRIPPLCDPLGMSLTWQMLPKVLGIFTFSQNLCTSAADGHSSTERAGDVEEEAQEVL